MSSDAAFLDAAAAIGRRIAADAMWDRGRCSWMGAVLDPEQPARVEYRALGPDLYGGTAGVGLFLAELAVATGEEPLRRTAVAALRHALGRARSRPPERWDGLHAGPVGVGWAAVRAAALLDEDELRASAADLSLAAARQPSGQDRCPDVVMGAAGALLGLVALAGALDEPRLLERAVLLGEELLAGAVVDRHGWSWALPGQRFPHCLCGLSHGAAGIGWALLELFVATGDQRFREGATHAFGYERSWLDAVAGAWPDLRLRQRRGVPRRIPSVATGTWCHGEAGIALTRLRAEAVLGAGPHGEDAELALRTTGRHVAEALPHAIEDFSLCHGAAGAADALLAGAARVGRPATVAYDLGQVALDRHAETGERWPCGTEPGVTPGLFLGTSGIGWLLLRFHDPTVPSPTALPVGVDTGQPVDVGSAQRSRMPSR